MLDRDSEESEMIWKGTIAVQARHVGASFASRLSGARDSDVPSSPMMHLVPDQVGTHYRQCGGRRTTETTTSRAAIVARPPGVFKHQLCFRKY